MAILEQMRPMIIAGSHATGAEMSRETPLKSEIPDVQLEDLSGL